MSGSQQQQQQQAAAVQQAQQAAMAQQAPPTRVPMSGAAATTAGGAAAGVPSQHAPPGAAIAHAAAHPQPHQSGIASGAVAPAPAASGGTGLATSSRSKYKTYILTNGVFEVERRYEIREIIGQGAYGVVCSALDRKTNSFVAVKKIENVFDHRSLAKRTLRELKLVRTFNHENILGLERVMRPHSSSFNNVYLVSELMETDLACVIRSPQDLSDEHVQFFIYQVLRGLKYIHSANVIHRDLKPRNLLVNSNCDLKICDFGLARVDEPDNADRTVMSNYVATRWYRAPEVILSRSKRYTKAVDLWSVGCILAELIGRKPIFPGRDSFHQITLILAVLGSPPASFNPSSASSASASSSSSTAAASGAAAAATAPSKSKSLSSGPTDDYILNLPKKARVPFRQLYPRASPLACDLLEKLLCFEPEKRLTVEQALRHPYLSDLHCEDDEPVCTHMDLCDFYFEYLRCSKDDLRVLIHQEIVNHYPEEAFDAVPAQAEGGGGGGPLDQFNAQMLKSLPKHQQAQQLPPQQPRKGRRKSF